MGQKEWEVVGRGLRAGKSNASLSEVGRELKKAEMDMSILHFLN